MQPDLTISIISADNSALLMPCLLSLFENTHTLRLEVFVVDNASANEPLADLVQAAFPQVAVIRNTQRLGFSTNNNLALQRGTGRYLMLLNDDTLILDGALDRMIAFMDEHPAVGCTGAYLLNPDGSFQAAYADFPRPVLEAIRPATNWSRAAQTAEPLAVDSVCGAALIVRRAASDQVGLLDTHFDPIYSEEVDWCYRIKQAGWQIYTLPHAQVIHYGSVTMNRAVPRKYELLLSHKALFFRKHRGPVAANVYRGVLLISTAIKVMWWSLKALIRRDDLSREKQRLHWAILKRIPAL